jgi:hypothetical protein
LSVSGSFEKYVHHCYILDINNQKIIGSFDKVKGIEAIKMIPDSTFALASNVDYEIFKLDIEDIHNIKIVGDPLKAEDKEIIPINRERALIGGFFSQNLYTLDINSWKFIENPIELQSLPIDLTFVGHRKLALTVVWLCNQLNIIDVQNQKILKIIDLPFYFWLCHRKQVIKVTPEGKFALITFEHGIISLFDIEKQELVGGPLKFIDSTGYFMKDLKFMIMPEEEETDFFNFQNFDLKINYKN